MNVVIRNGRLVDPGNNVDSRLDLYLSGGQVAAVGQAPSGFVVDRELDATGLVVCPGLVDLSARLGHLKTELGAAAASGVTTLVCPPDINPPLDEPELVERLVRQAKDLAKSRVLPLGAMTQKLEGEKLAEMAGLRKAGCIAFSQGKHPVLDTQALLRAFEYAATFDFPIWLQPQDYYLSRNGFAHDGAMVTRLGLVGIPVSAETIAISTYLILAANTGVRLHLRRISSAEGMAMVARAKAEGVAVTCDVGIHHLHLSEHDIGFFNTNARFDPPLRSTEDRDGLGRGVADGFASICSDHNPLGQDDKLVPFDEAKPGATGLELLLPLTLKWAATQGVSLSTALTRITRDPAAILRRDDLGHLAPGAKADVCIFSEQESWTLDEKSLRSRGKSTPFLGQQLSGRVKAGLFGGQVVFNEL